MRVERADITWLLALSLALVPLSAFLGMAPVVSASSHRLPHDPIFIGGNQDFTPANGVTGGIGTAEDPYLIAGWQINATAGTGIHIRNTDTHFKISDVHVHSSREAIFLSNVTNGRIENSTVSINEIGIGLSTSSGITILNNNITSNVDSGIVVFLNSMNILIGSNIISKNREGIHASFSTRLTMEKNTVWGNDVAIRFLLTNNTTIADNSVSNNNRGISLSDSTHAIIIGNALTSDGLHLSGDSVSHFNTHTITPDNLVNGRPLYYYKDCSGIVVDGVPVGQLIVANCTGFGAANLRLEDTDVGIQMAFVTDSQISSNVVTSTSLYGIHFFRSSGISVLNCSVSRNSQGIFVSNSEDITVGYSNVSNNGDGIGLLATTSAELRDNIVSENGRIGIRIDGSAGTRILRNTISRNSGGIRFQSSTNVTMRGNSFTLNGILFSDDVILVQSESHFNTHTITPDNLVNGRPLYYYKDCSGIEVDGVPVGQLIVANCTSVRVANVTIMETAVGIQMAFVEDVHLANITVAKNKFGIRLYRSKGISILDTISASNTLQGVFLGIVSDVEISNGTISNNGDGVITLVATNITISYSTVLSNARHGIGLANSAEVVVRANTVSNNEYGILLVASANASIRGNTVAFNRYGIFLGLVTGAQTYHNSLIENEVQGFDNRADENAWDAGYPKGGNFWSNYTGSDICSGIDQDVCPSPDGIGDVPQVIDRDSRDYYPLILPPNMPPVASFILTPASGDVTTIFVVDANNSSDSLDSSEELEIRWDWQGDGVWDTPWITEKVAQHQYSEAATYTIRLEVRNTRGIRDLTARQVLVTPDAQPPQVMHEPDDEVLVGEPILIVATVRDAGGIQTVMLFYSGVDGNEFSALVMSSIGNDTFEVALPSQGRAGIVEYYIIATDEAGNAARSPDLGQYVLIVRDQTAPLGPISRGILALAGTVITIFLYVLVRRIRSRTSLGKEALGTRQAKYAQRKQ